MAKISTREKGEFLEDAAADLFRSWGFDVQKRTKLKDRFGVRHEIDVLATKKEAWGASTVAVECKYLKTQATIKDIRNFHDKLASLGITKGMVVSAGGFTSDARDHAKALDLGVWDLATLQAKIAKARPAADMVNDALPLNPRISTSLFPPHLSNRDVLSLTGAQLTYHPYYFVGYHCFSQDRVGGEVKTLESKGVVVVDAITGKIVDYKVNVGAAPALSRSAGIAKFSVTSPTTLSFDQLFPKNFPVKVDVKVRPPELTEMEAKSLARREVTKSLSAEFGYPVGRVLRTKVVRPRISDVEISSCKFFNVPFLEVELSFKIMKYSRVIQAATGKTLSDESNHCSFCYKLPTVVCEECGRLVCKKHSKQCHTCEKNLCRKHVVSKGIILRKDYCKKHAPKRRTTRPAHQSLV